MFIKLLYIALGSGIGGMCRYLTGRLIHPSFYPGFPWGTLVVNVTGCFVIGFIYGLIDRGFSLSENMKLFLTVGFCGGFTTFSTFMNENYLLFEKTDIMSVVLYSGISFAVGLLLIYGGYYLSKICYDLL